MNVDLNKTNVKVEKQMLKRMKRTSKVETTNVESEKKTNVNLEKRMTNFKNECQTLKTSGIVEF